jgi:dihydroflavonol-4-reductase
MAAQGRIPVYVDATLNVIDGRDVGFAHIAAAKRGRAGERYLLGAHNMTLEETLTVAATVVGRNPPRVELPLWLVKGAGDFGSWLGISGLHHLRAVRHWQPLNVQRTRKQLQLPEPIPFERTCRDTLTWFHKQGMLNRGPAESDPSGGDQDSQGGS